MRKPSLSMLETIGFKKTMFNYFIPTDKSFFFLSQLDTVDSQVLVFLCISLFALFCTRRACKGLPSGLQRFTDQIYRNLHPYSIVKSHLPDGRLLLRAKVQLVVTIGYILRTRHPYSFAKLSKIFQITRVNLNSYVDSVLAYVAAVVDDVVGDEEGTARRYVHISAWSFEWWRWWVGPESISEMLPVRTLVQKYERYLLDVKTFKDFN